MRKIALILAAIVGLFPAIAPAQQFNTIPDHTVIGRIGTGSGSGPSQAIPFATLLANMSSVQLPNLVYASPVSGGAALPAFRALVGADLPVPGATTLGGVKSLTCSTSNWFNTLSTAGALGCSQPSFANISGTVAASQLPTPTATTLGGIESITQLAHNWVSYIDTLGVPHQSQPFCADVSDASVYCNATRGQLPGSTTNDTASAGNIAENPSSTVPVGSAVVLTTATPANVTSISLSAGTWDVTGQVYFLFGASTSGTVFYSSISTTSATLNTTAGQYNAYATNTALVPGNFNESFGPLGTVRFTLSATTTIYLVAQSSFTVSTMNAWGTIRATRVR